MNFHLGLKEALPETIEQEFEQKAGALENIMLNIRDKFREILKNIREWFQLRR